MHDGGALLLRTIAAISVILASRRIAPVSSFVFASRTLGRRQVHSYTYRPSRTQQSRNIARAPRCTISAPIVKWAPYRCGSGGLSTSV